MPKKEFTATEVMALQENIDKKLTVIGEQFFYIKEKLDKVSDSVEILKEDMQIVKYSLRQKVDLQDFQALEKRVIRLEKKIT
jgi:hypothetical protein